MAEVNEQLIAKYPFLSQAKNLLEDTENVGYQEIENAVSNTAAFIRQPTVLPPMDAKTEVKRLALSRLLLTALGNPVASRKFASNYGKLLKKRLRDEDDKVLQSVAGDFLPTLVESSGGYAVSLLDFLNKGGELKEAELDKGIVYLNRDDLVALVVKAVEAKLSSFASRKKIPKEFAEAAEELRERMPIIAARSNFKGKYLQLPCIKFILQGLPEGKRFYGGMTLAIACLKDGLSKEQAEVVMQDFVNANQQSTHEYSLREAVSALDWVYKRGSIGFSCKVTQSNGLGGDYCLTDCVFKKRSGK
ncbi:MAG: hypothetical protein V1834_01715 [Candidatus Micrarchaeota archaeon]